VWVALFVVAAGATGLYLHPERDRLIGEFLHATGLNDKTVLRDAWRQAESLRGDPNQSLAAIVAGYRRVLEIDPTVGKAHKIIATLATDWKTSIAQRCYR
jgi:hypothetical protein